MDADGRNAMAIRAADAGHGYPPVWPPDGAALAFAAQPHGGLPSMWAAAPEASTERLYPLTANTPASRPEQFVRTLCCRNPKCTSDFQP